MLQKIGAGAAAFCGYVKEGAPIIVDSWKSNKNYTDGVISVVWLSALCLGGLILLVGHLEPGPECNPDAETLAEYQAFREAGWGMVLGGAAAGVAHAALRGYFHKKADENATQHEF